MDCGCGCVDRRDVEAREVRDFEERRDRPEAFERVSLPVLVLPLLLLRAFKGGGRCRRRKKKRCTKRAIEMSRCLLMYLYGLNWAGDQSMTFQPPVPLFARLYSSTDAIFAHIIY